MSSPIFRPLDPRGRTALNRSTSACLDPPQISCHSAEVQVGHMQGSNTSERCVCLYHYVGAPTAPPAPLW